MSWILENFGGPAVFMFLGGVVSAWAGFASVRGAKWAAQGGFVGAFLMTVAGLWASYEQSQIQRELVGAIIGGDSFCYVDFVFDGAVNRPELVVTSEGKYPLYDVHVRIVDLQKFEAVTGKGAHTFDDLQQAHTTIDVGNLAPSITQISGRWELGDTDRPRFNVFIGARNGWVTQALRIARLGGRWAVANRVTRDADGKVLREKVDPAFPRNERGEVEW